MLFYSTNRKSPPVDFETALMQGLAPDGGLYFPEKFPKLTQIELENLKGASLEDIAYFILHKWIGDEIFSTDLKRIVKQALDFPINIKDVGDFQIMELFHGPTMAFKDVAAKTLAQLTSYFLKKNGKKATILVATSGDTGGAVAQGFAGVENVKVVVLYPKGKVSKLQEEQLTRVADNVTSIEIDGTFDECQTFVKQAFVDPDLKKLNLTSANSINIGRLIPQIIYYAYAYAQTTVEKPKVIEKTDDETDEETEGEGAQGTLSEESSVADIEFIIPSGNMGSVTAGLFAREMGFPFHSFIIACNENDPVVKYYETGVYNSQPSVPTMSNAMDIGAPSNFTRILELFDHSHLKFAKVVRAIKISDEETKKTIEHVHKRYSYLLDPHTAVAWAATEQMVSRHMNPIILSTASPVKFASEIEKATGIEVSDKKEIEKLKALPQRKVEVKNKYEEVKKILLSFHPQ